MHAQSHYLKVTIIVGITRLDKIAKLVSVNSVSPFSLQVQHFPRLRPFSLPVIVFHKTPDMLQTQPTA